MTYYKPNYEDFGCCHIKLYAFHYFSVCANICPIDTIPRVFLLFFPFSLHPLDSPPLGFLDTVRFASPLHDIFLPSPPLQLQRKKQAERGWGFPKIKKIKKIDLYCLSFLYLLFQVSNRMKIIETKDLFSLFSLFSFWGSRKIKKMNMVFLYFLYFLFEASGK